MHHHYNNLLTFFTFRVLFWCGASKCHMAPNVLGLIYVFMPPGQTEPPPKEVFVVVWQQSLFWPFVCMHGWDLLFIVCLCLSGVLIISFPCQWLKWPAEICEFLSKRCRGMEEEAFFSMYLSSPGLHYMWLSVLLHCLAATRAPQPILFLHLHSKVAILYTPMYFSL